MKFIQVCKDIISDNIFVSLQGNNQKKINKPLIIVGDPHNGQGSYINAKLLMQGYGYEVMEDEILIDLFPCKICKTKTNTMQGDLLEMLKGLKSDKFVIYVCLTLEYVPYIRIKEIKILFMHLLFLNLLNINCGARYFSLDTSV